MPREAQKILPKIYREHDEFYRRVKNLDCLVRLEFGQVFPCRPVDLYHLAKTRAETTVTESGTNRPLLQDEPAADGEKYLLSTNEEAVDIMLRNLISNSVRYSPEEASVRVAVAREGDAICVKVWDTGGPNDAATEVVEEFLSLGRGDLVPRADEKRGIGLRLCARLCVAIGADVSVDRACQEGVCVQLTFPTRTE